MAAISQLLEIVRRGRIATAPPGEFVIDRNAIGIDTAPLESGSLYMTHFVALETETIAAIRTGTGGAATTAGATTHAWAGIVAWDGTDYTPAAESGDLADAFEAEFTAYDFELTAPWTKTAGRDYAVWYLWIGTGQSPALPDAGGFYQQSTVEPRTNAYLSAQTGPPADPIAGSGFAPDSRRYQALLLKDV